MQGRCFRPLRILNECLWSIRLSKYNWNSEFKLQARTGVRLNSSKSTNTLPYNKILKTPNQEPKFERFGDLRLWIWDLWCGIETGDSGLDFVWISEFRIQILRFPDFSTFRNANIEFHVWISKGPTGPNRAKTRIWAIWLKWPEFWL